MLTNCKSTWIILDTSNDPIHSRPDGGNSFRELLQTEFGERLMSDYGDWAGVGFRKPSSVVEAVR